MMAGVGCKFTVHLGSSTAAILSNGVVTTFSSFRSSDLSQSI